ncbi:MAG: 16S rRNA (adenine(1518)-N(6)/adenine(1519)-N(6))-dimethyltransferase RsmA [Desulfobacterales bacterium]|jgi:16S rRNA (adenine1518-N6/adenine1519-N6)-dimethyltransferase|nr:ribosomal RNA small subunit methyltransferase A [Deltaproteobacteria bacterium]
MTSPKALLKAWNLRPKKRLGQHFLVDPSTADLIARHTRITSEDTVIEIGAGLGALTIPLARMAARVYAVEKDSQLTQLLKTELLVHNLTNVQIIEQNILNVDLQELIQKSDRPLIVTGNLPYNISSQVIVQLIEARRLVKHAILMFQKELARRITAKPGKKDYGRLTVMLAYCADIKSIATVNASLFYPEPKVDSEVVEINFNVNRQYPPHDEVMLFQVIKAAFGNRRKTLKNALSISGLQIEPLMAQQALRAAGIDPGRRAETLDAAEFVALQISLSQAAQ